MKQLLIAFAACIVLLSACKKDETTPATLHYDGDNIDAPSMPANTYEAAAKFSETMLSPYKDNQITKVEYYLKNLPDSARVVIYEGTELSTTGSIVYSADVTSSMTANSWNTHTLTTPLTVGSNRDLWVAIRFKHATSKSVIGCDAGPRNANGDWLYDSSDKKWETFLLRTANSVNVNWNIRITVE